MAVHPPQRKSAPVDGEERQPAGGTSPLSGPAIIWAVFIVLALVLAIMLAMGIGFAT